MPNETTNQSNSSEPKLDPHPQPKGPLGARDVIGAFNSNTTGQFYAMSDRDRKFFNDHVRRIVADYEPQSPREHWLANAIAEDMWRLDRARAIENNIYALTLDLPLGAASLTDRGPAHTAITQARCWMEDPTAFQALAMAEQRIRRGIAQNEKELRKLQSERKAAFDRAVEEAILLFRLAQQEGRTWKAEEDFRIETVAAAPQPPIHSGATSRIPDPDAPAPEGKTEVLKYGGFTFPAVEFRSVVRRELRLQTARAARKAELQNKPIPLAVAYRTAA